MKDDLLAIEIPEEEYIAGFDECKFNLHGRIIWPKGSKSVTIDNLRNKLSIMWKSIGRWGITSVGRGFYEFTFSSLEDMKRVRVVGSGSLNPGILKHFAWTKDFSPSTLQQTTTQVWLRIYGLSQEYWRKKILFASASSVGTPICTDSITSKPRIERSYGDYARVLVDLDLSQELRYRVLVERKGFTFFVDFEYENLPEFCNHCNYTGHSIDNYKRLQENKGKQPLVHKAKQVFVVKTKMPKVIPVVSNARSKEDIQLEQEVNKALETDVNDNNDVNNNIDVEAERNINEETYVDADEVQSSEGSEFVEATQQNFDSESTNNTSPIPYEAAVLKDMEFLKKSWANLADIEEREDF